RPARAGAPVCRCCADRGDAGSSARAVVARTRRADRGALRGLRISPGRDAAPRAQPPGGGVVSGDMVREVLRDDVLRDEAAPVRRVLARELRQEVESVTDPEIPTLTIGDMGIV